ncbi:unnamed protein product [Rhizophagus irregularis]|nr:unnamed protein product [Rhizophagus irregularis]
MMIKEAIEKDDVVTSGSIIQGNMLKAYFNKETLQEIHMSLNNIDKLRYLVAKTYKNLYPFEQHIFQSVYSKQFDLHNYVIKIDFFGNELVLIIDLFFKRVKRNINEFEINSYDYYHNLILSYCRDLDMGQMKGLGLALHSLDTTREWEVHITNIFFKEM